MEEREHIEGIIYRHLNGETSPGEEAALQAWLAENLAHREEFDALEKTWNESSGLLHQIGVDKSAAWRSMEDKISRWNSRAGQREIFSMPKLLRMAGIVILFAVLAVVAHYMFTPYSSFSKQVEAIVQNETVELPDGSIVSLRKGSELQYNPDFTRKRNVELSGEAYFDVVSNKNLPFRINTQKITIEVLGTAFLVRSSTTAEQVFVTRGEVKITAHKDDSKTIILSAGQTASLHGKDFEEENIADSNYLSWRSGILRFDHVPLKKMIMDLNQNFKVNIRMSDALRAKSDTIKVNFRFENSSLDQILDEIHLTTGLIVDRNKDNILLQEK